MKLEIIVRALPALQKVAQMPLTAKSLYRMSKLLSKLDTEIEFYNSERAKIVREYGEEINPDEWKIKSENADVFNKRFGELLNIEVESDITIVKIPVTEDIKLTYNDICALKGLVELDCEDDN